MSLQNPPTLGTCPVCETEVASYDVHIEYEDPDGQPAIYTECPACRDVVNPK